MAKPRASVLTTTPHTTCSSRDAPLLFKDLFRWEGKPASVSESAKWVHCHLPHCVGRGGGNETGSCVKRSALTLVPAPAAVKRGACQSGRWRPKPTGGVSRGREFEQGRQECLRLGITEPPTPPARQSSKFILSTPAEPALLEVGKGAKCH